jgi:flagellar biosynthesis protein FlhA
MKQHSPIVSTAPHSWIGTVRRALFRGDIALALGVIGILLVLLFPVATLFLDFLLAVSITISVVILLTCLFIDKPLHFSSFPTILLVTAVMRLSLNIASTRLILANGHTGTDAAGHVIEAFGNFVMGSNIVIGAIVFGILTIINFVVITKGSGRIAEVAARFSLDAMPGKQMAIDADLSAGLIDEVSARNRRKELEDESTFYGSMDGANKFVRGDAIAGLLITFINFIAGIIIGVAQRDMSFMDALQTYTTLTIGDGLVSQIPALIISLAAGLLVSKSGVAGSADKAIFGQLSQHPHALGLAGFLLFLMGLMPGLPAVPFFFLALVCGTSAAFLAFPSLTEKITPKWMATTDQQAKDALASQPQTTKEVAASETAKITEEQLSDALRIDILKLELGYGLLPLLNYQKGHKLTEQIKALRRQMAKDLGFVMPAVRIQDNMQLPTHSYVIRVKDIECAKGEVKPDMLLVMDPAGGEVQLPGEKTREPAFGLPALWVADNLREDALFKNYTVVDPPTVITTHLTEIIKENVTELLSYSETQKLLDDIDDGHRKLVSETIPSAITISGLQRILQNLLSESVSIRDLATIIEAIAEATRFTQSLVLITEHVRLRLARQISHANISPQGYIPILALSPQWEQIFSESLIGQGDEKQLAIPPSKLQEFINTIRTKMEDIAATQGEVPVLLVSPAIRPYVRSLIERFRSSTVVLSQNEIHSKSRIKTLGQL